MLVLKAVHKRYGLLRVLEGVSFAVGEGQKVAVVGNNGTGKSTLLRIIAGVETFERGKRTIPNRILIGYLPQETPVFDTETVEEYLFRQSGIKEFFDIMEAAKDYLHDPHQLARFEAAEEMYEKLGGRFFLKKAHQHLKGLLLSDIALTTPAKTLSGGQKRKLALAGVLLRGVDLLVLDEPTNNLDLPALAYLEKFLAHSKATVIMASHDRTFLDKIVQKVFEIDWYTRSVEQFAGGYSDYAEQKAHKIRRQYELWQQEKTEKARLEDSELEKKEWVEKLDDVPRRDNNKLVDHFKRERAAKKFNASAKAITSRMKRLNKHDEPLLRQPPQITLSVPEEATGKITFFRTLIGYESGFQLGPFSITIPFGTRVGFLGNNGSGKTTLLKTLIGEQLPLSGKISIGSGIRFGYFLQEHDALNQEQTVFDYLRKNDVESFNKDEILFALGKFNFSPDVIDDKLRHLSPGERVRVILVRLVLLGANTLVLDEPTNHLDLDAIEALEAALESFPGTLLVVSHDRTFLQNLGIDTWYTVAENKIAEVTKKLEV